MTFFMADAGLEDCGPLDVDRLLEESGAITNHDAQELSIHRFVDPAGTACLSISYVVVDEEDEAFAEANQPLLPYVGNAE